MPFKRNPQEFTASISEVVIGTGDKAITLGGENVFPLYSFDAAIKNRPSVGVEVTDLGVDKTLPGMADFYSGADTVVDQAVRAAAMPGADFVCLFLESADPNGQDSDVDTCAALCKAVADAIDVPLVVRTTGNADKDGKLIEKIANVLDGKNALMMSAREDNYKGIAVGAVLAYNQKVGAESAVDINLAKQLNVLISQMGVKNNSVVMNVGSAAAGYGFEYVVSTMDRIRGAALSQNDTMLQMPIITPISDAWSVKEALVSEKDFPEWGPQETRGVDMEISTAVSCLASGSNAVILRHPQSVDTVSKFVAELV